MSSCLNFLKLPIALSINFKLLFVVLHNVGPASFSELTSYRSLLGSLQTNSCSHCRAFTVTILTPWNAILSDLCKAEFYFKCHLLKEAFSEQLAQSLFTTLLCFIFIWHLTTAEIIELISSLPIFSPEFKHHESIVIDSLIHPCIPSAKDSA